MSCPEGPAAPQDDSSIPLRPWSENHPASASPLQRGTIPPNVRLEPSHQPERPFGALQIVHNPLDQYRCATIRPDASGPGDRCEALTGFGEERPDSTGQDGC